MEVNRAPTVLMVDPQKLRIHPLLEKYFPCGTEEEMEDLRESIKKVGILHPIVANKKGEIVSGRDRLNGGKGLGLRAVPVRFMDFKTVDNEEVAILVANLIVRGLSPSIVARGRERYGELISSNGSRPQFGNGLEQMLRSLPAQQQKRIHREVDQIAQEEAEKKASKLVEKSSEQFEKKMELLGRENKNLKGSLEQVMEARDGLQSEVTGLYKEKDELTRDAEKARAEKEQVRRENQALQREIDKLRGRVEKTAGVKAPRFNTGQQRIMSLALQISRIGPETVLPCVVEHLDGKDRKREIFGALGRISSHCQELRGALGG